MYIKGCPSFGLSRRSTEVRFMPSMKNEAAKARKKLSPVFRQNFKKKNPAATEVVAIMPSKNPSIIFFSRCPRSARIATQALREPQ